MLKCIATKDCVAATGCCEIARMQFRKNNVMANLWKNNIPECDLFVRVEFSCHCDTIDGGCECRLDVRWE